MFNLGLRGSWSPSAQDQRRSVELTVPLGTEVLPSIAVLVGSTLRTPQPPLAVTARTLKSNTTAEAVVGAPGELMLGRVAPVTSG